MYGLKFAFNDYFKNMVAPGVAKPTTAQLMLVSNAHSCLFLSLTGTSSMLGYLSFHVPRLARA